MTRTPGLPGLGSGPAQTSAAPFAPLNVEALLSGAIQAHEAARLDEAERDYRLALKMAPRDPRIPAHLGVLMLERGRNEEGVQLLDQTLALDPRQPGMLTNRGAALIQLGRFEEGLSSYNLAIAQQPEDARHEAFNNLGVHLQSLDRYAEAADAYAKAVALKPDFPEGWGNRGIALLTAERPLEAIEAFDRAVALKPDYADAWTNRGIALQDLGRLGEALDSFDRALSLQPGIAEIWNNRSMTLQGLSRFDEAVEASARAVEIGGEDMPEAWNNHGIALQSVSRIDEALASFDHAIALKPDYAEAHWNKSLALLATGDYEAGWRLYEWRWKRTGPGVEKPREFGCPLWLGETPIAGKTLFLHAEQGFGDTICMLRYAPRLAALGAKVIASVPKPLIELTRGVDGIHSVVETDGVRISFDLHTPVMSLPLAMGARVDSATAVTPYIPVPPAAAARWANKLGPRTRRRVGLAWSGNAAQKNDHNRSMALATLLPLLDADWEFHSVQKDYRDSDAALLRTDGRITDHAQDLQTFSDTAALIDEMDLVISVCTSTAHLAGALGRPLLVMLTKVPDYRWGLERTDSSWYPTARLLRQTTTGDWSPVIAAALEALKA